MEEAKVIGKTVAIGKQRWRLNEDGTWNVLMFGSFRPNQNDLHWEWVYIDIKKVPKEVLEVA